METFIKKLDELEREIPKDSHYKKLYLQLIGDLRLNAENERDYEVSGSLAEAVALKESDPAGMSEEQKLLIARQA